MNKVVLIPDSFKGTMSSSEICNIMESAVLRHFADVSVVAVPVADGGEGSVDAFLKALSGEKIYKPVSGPYFDKTNAFFAILDNGTAVIEMSAAAGLPLVGENKHAEKTTTYGVGELIASAAEHGCKAITVCLGGSATNDGGCGAAAALGAKFYDKSGNEFIPVGETLINIERIDISSLTKKLCGIEISTMCDIDNPLCGKRGAAAVFAPQKGADESTVALLDSGLLHMAKIIKRDLGVDITKLKGAGAAGGMGGGMAAFFGSRLKSGIETVLDITSFDATIENADIVFTGEGKIDSQSLDGKVISGVAKRTKKAGVPLIAVVGDIGEDIEKAYDNGVSAIFSINNVALPFSEARLRCKQDMANTMDNIMRLLKAAGCK